MIQYADIVYDKYIFIKWNNSNKFHYINLGYNFTKNGDVFKVLVLDLLPNSTNKVKCKCRVCNKIFLRIFRHINNNTLCSKKCECFYKNSLKTCNSCGVKRNEVKVFRYIKNEMFCDKCYNLKINNNIRSQYDKNEILYYHDFAQIVIQDNKGENKEFANIDLDDVDKIKDIKWRLNEKKYVYGSIKDNGSLKLHRIIMNCDKDKEVNHIYFNPLENRKKYLEVVSHKDNCQRRNKIKSIRVMDIYNDSICDGFNLRDVIFVNMCCHKCKMCHNQQSWYYKNGYDMSFNDIFDKLKNNNDLTLSGGEPMLQSIELYLFIIKYIKPLNKNIWIYSGYTFEEIIKDDKKRLLLELCDILVDGKFEIKNKSMDLLYCGSSNQRIIDIKASLRENKVILLQKEVKNDNKYNKNSIFI